MAVLFEHRENIRLAHATEFSARSRRSLWLSHTLEMTKAISCWPDAFKCIMRELNCNQASGDKVTLSDKVTLDGKMVGDGLGDAGSFILALLLDKIAFPLRELSLKENHVSDFGASRLFSSSIQWLSSLQKLVLDGNELGLIAMRALAAAGRQGALKALQVLSLCDNPKACKLEEGAQELAGAIHNMPDVEQLLLSRVSLSSVGAGALSRVLDTDNALPKLSRLNLNYNRAMGDAGVSSITTALTAKAASRKQVFRRFQIDGIAVGDGTKNELSELEKAYLPMKLGIQGHGLETKLKALEGRSPPLESKGSTRRLDDSSSHASSQRTKVFIPSSKHAGSASSR